MKNHIEEAAKRMGESGEVSLIERAANRLGSAVIDADAEARVEQSPPTGDAASQRAALKPVSRTSKFAEIDIVHAASRNIVAVGPERSRVSEEFRVIKRQVLRKAFANGADAIGSGNLIMVTSAAPNEGKTFAAVNLAVSIASERDKHVLLVDADLHRPGVLDSLGIEADRGLVDVLEDPSIDLSEVLIRTSFTNLTILPAGRAHEMGAELIASERMADLVAEIGKRYSDRVVIFDTSPVLATSEASTLVSHVGQVILVVEAERTSEAAVRAALDLLSPCKDIGFVLNKAQGNTSSADFGSYHRKYYRELKE